MTTGVNGGLGDGGGGKGGGEGGGASGDGGGSDGECGVLQQMYVGPLPSAAW
tara:strand:- start:477 stop:632 length:156 start_codon:yes stop_codon:yes gene_type:complete